MEMWEIWKKRIIKYSHLEKVHRPKLRELLMLLESAPENSDTVDTGMFQD